MHLKNALLNTQTYLEVKLMQSARQSLKILGKTSSLMCHFYHSNQLSLKGAVCRHLNRTNNIKKAIWNIIGYEAPLANIYALICVNRLLPHTSIMRNTVPFGGKIVLLGKDFRRVLPIVLHGSRVSICYVKTSKFAWEKCKWKMRKESLHSSCYKLVIVHSTTENDKEILELPGASFPKISWLVFMLILLRIFSNSPR